MGAGKKSETVKSIVQKSGLLIPKAKMAKRNISTAAEVLGQKDIFIQSFKHVSI